jgi:hypothetical protein
MVTTRQFLKFLLQLLVQMLQLLVHIFVFLIFFVTLGSAAVVARSSVRAVAGLWWIAGVVLGLAWLVGIIGLCVVLWYSMRASAPEWLRSYVLLRKSSDRNAGLAEQYPEASLSALICVAILAAVLVLSVVSEILEARGVFTYAIKGAFEQPMFERLFRLYFWHTIDMVPFIDVWETYDIEPPLQPTNFWAQSTVLVFRTALAGFAISVIAQLVSFYRDQSSNKVSPNAATASLN